YLTKPWDEETLLSAVRAAAVRGRDTTHCVLLVGNDSERLAPFQVIMGIRVLAVAMALEEALVGPALKPWLIVLDGGVDPTHDATALRILAERYPGRPTIVTTRSPASVLRADVCAMADVVAAPYHVSDILNRIHRILSTRVGHTKSGPWLSHHVGGAIDYLTDHYRAVVPLANVARFAGLSVDRLAHVFRAKVGMTMKEYAARLRVCVGCQLLAHSDRKLEDIAQCLGFDHASHFSRVFTDMMGLRPGEYRRRVRGDGGGYLSCWRSSAAGSTTTTPRCLTRRWGCEVRPSAEWKRL